MRHLGTVIGAMIAGIFINSVWGVFVGEYGIGGGVFSGFMIISVMAFMNHVLGLMHNDGAWVDMAIGIGVAGVVYSTFKAGTTQAMVDAIPTFILVVLGGIVGGIVAGKIQVIHASDKE